MKKIVSLVVSLVFLTSGILNANNVQSCSWSTGSCNSTAWQYDGFYVIVSICGNNVYEWEIEGEHNFPPEMCEDDEIGQF